MRKISVETTSHPVICFKKLITPVLDVMPESLAYFFGQRSLLKLLQWLQLKYTWITFFMRGRDVENDMSVCLSFIYYVWLLLIQFSLSNLYIGSIHNFYLIKSTLSIYLCGRRCSMWTFKRFDLIYMKKNACYYIRPILCLFLYSYSTRMTSVIDSKSNLLIIIYYY